MAGATGVVGWRAVREPGSSVPKAARAAGAERRVQESLVLNYPDRGADWIEETVPLAPAGPPAAAVEAEASARAFGDAVILRFGTFYGADSDHSHAEVRQAQAGSTPNPAPKEAYASRIWLDDAGRAVAAALAAPAGTYNVVEDEPSPRKAADVALATAVGRARLRAPLAPVGRFLPPLRVLARSLRVSNRAFREATGWTPEVASPREAWPRLVAELERAEPGGLGVAAGARP